MNIDEALKSPENYAQYIRQLPDVTSDSLYRIEVETSEGYFTRDLLMADTDSEGIAEFDLHFLEVHREEIVGEPRAMRLFSPVEHGERTLVAEITL